MYESCALRESKGIQYCMSDLLPLDIGGSSAPTHINDRCTGRKEKKNSQSSETSVVCDR